MSTFQVYGRISGRVDNTVVAAGSLEKPVNIALGTDSKYDQVFSIANSANSVIYNTTLADFDLLYVESDFNVRIKLTDTNSNTFSLWLKGTGVAGRYGVPLMLGLDDTSASQTLVTLQAFNTSGNTAKVHIIAAT